MKHATFADAAPWPVTLVVLGTLITSAIRGLGSPGYGPVPALSAFDAIKFLDPVLLLAVAGLAALNAIARRTRTFPVWKVGWGGGAAFVLLIGITSAVFWAVPVYDAAQSILFVLRPACLLLIFTAFRWDARRSWIARAVLLFAAANVSLVTLQWLAVRAAGPASTPDAIVGLFHDAHQQATFSFTLALLSIAYLVDAENWPRRLALGAFIGANVFTGVVSQAQKSTGIEIAVFTGAIVVLVLRSRVRLVRAAKLVPAAALTMILALTVVSGTTIWTSAAEMVTGNLMNRLDYGGYRGLAFLSDVGAVRMAGDFWSMSAAAPAVVFIGAGPANYGSPAALRRVEQGKTSVTIRELFWWEATKENELVETGELRLLGLSAKTSLPGIVLGEYGVVALLAFMPLVLWPLFITPRRVDGVEAHRDLFWVKVAYLGVVAQSALNTLGAWDNDVVMTLLFLGFASLLAVREGPELA